MRKLIFLLLFSFIVGYAQPKDPTLTKTNKSIFQIAFEKDNDICTINIYDTNLICLINSPDLDAQNPVFSPNGRFLTYRTTNKTSETTTFVTYVHDLETDVVTQLPEAWRIYDWSPDSRYLLTTGAYDAAKNLRDIAIVQFNGSDFQTLTDGENLYSQPTWSPDGSQIAYISGFPDASLMVMSATGENRRVLTEGLDVSGEVQPQWSPDSQTIAFVVNGQDIHSDPTSEVYTMHADGTDLSQVTDTGGANLDPRWSPDGTQLVFYGYQPGAFDSENSADPDNFKTEVFRINADGTNLVDLTQNPGLDFQPTWSPDGEWIAFGSNRVWEGEPRPGIFIMRPDGSDLQMITNEPTFAFVQGGGNITNPVWRPVPKD